MIAKRCDERNTPRGNSKEKLFVVMEPLNLGIQGLKLQYYERWKITLLNISSVGILRAQYHLYQAMISLAKIYFAGINKAWKSGDTPIDSRALERFKVRRWIQQR